jgi:peptidoglycan/xylan/chitin deacetylase (PgdA/CDA1 family)
MPRTATAGAILLFIAATTAASAAWAADPPSPAVAQAKTPQYDSRSDSRGDSGAPPATARSLPQSGHDNTSPAAGPRVLPGTSLPPPPGLDPNKYSSAQALALLQAEHDAFWQNARRVVPRSVMELVAQRQTELERGLRSHVVMRGETDRKEVALTFDDGPHPNFTPQLLDVLKKQGVPATFFVVGELAEKNPDLIRAEVANGHLVGNHTYHHVSLIRIPNDYVADEIKTCGEVLQRITGKAPDLFRPPGGVYDTEVAEIAEALGYTTVLWTDDPADYTSPGDDVILLRTLRTASSGGIILLHDGIQQTIDVLPRLIASLRQDGYSFVTVDRLIADRDRAGVRRVVQQTGSVETGSVP